MAAFANKNVPNTPEKRAFASVLVELRERRGLTQEQLGFESGYHPKYISLLERARFSPSLTTILELADALTISASEMIRRVEKILPRDRQRRRDIRPAFEGTPNGGWRSDPAEASREERLHPSVHQRLGTT